MKFLENSKNGNHLTTLTEKLELYDEAFFAVAFLKVSGLTKLIQTIKKFLKSGKQISSDNADEATLLVIKQYETFYEQQKQYNKKAKPIPIKTKSQIAFDYHNLLKHFQKFDNVKRQERFKNKLHNYKEAKKVLDEI